MIDKKKCRCTFTLKTYYKSILYFLPSGICHLKPYNSVQTCHFLFSSSSGIPCSQILPPSSTTIWSALRTVRIRWAMIITVLLRTSSEIAACIFVSFSASRLAVASSSKIMGASFRRARAIEIRCRSPPERVSPFSAIIVLYPCGIRLIKSSHCASRATCRTSSSVALRLPIRILSAIEVLNNTTS